MSSNKSSKNRDSIIWEDTDLSASSEVVVNHKVGLHARPAALFVKTAATFSSSILLENLTKGTPPVNGKSIMNVLASGTQSQDRLRITAEGNDENAAVTALCQLINTNFGELEREAKAE